MFSGHYHGFFTLASSVGCWLEVVEVYPWLFSLRGFAVEGVDLVLYQVLVGLPSWCCCASRLFGHLSQVGLVLILHPGFLFSGLVERGAFHRVPSPLSSFRMWSPFGVISVLCHYCSPTKVAIGGGFLLCGSLPFISAVVVSLRPLSLCLGS